MKMAITLSLLLVLSAVGLMFLAGFVQTSDIRANASQALAECGAGNVQSVSQDGYRCINNTVDAAT